MAGLLDREGQMLMNKLFVVDLLCGGKQNITIVQPCAFIRLVCSCHDPAVLFCCPRKCSNALGIRDNRLSIMCVSWRYIFSNNRKQKEWLNDVHYTWIVCLNSGGQIGMSGRCTVLSTRSMFCQSVEASNLEVTSWIMELIMPNLWASNVVVFSLFALTLGDVSSIFVPFINSHC